jgi:hypothetical protein
MCMRRAHNVPEAGSQCAAAHNRGASGPLGAVGCCPFRGSDRWAVGPECMTVTWSASQSLSRSVGRQLVTWSGPLGGTSISRRASGRTPCPCAPPSPPHRLGGVVEGAPIKRKGNDGGPGRRVDLLACNCKYGQVYVGQSMIVQGSSARGGGAGNGCPGVAALRFSGHHQGWLAGWLLFQQSD